MLELYKNIKLKRMEKDWSQNELAKRVGYSDKSMISKIENGKVDLSQSQIQAFADVFGCTASELMGWSDEIEIENEINVEAIKLYYKYLATDKKTKLIINTLLNEDNA